MERLDELKHTLIHVRVSNGMVSSLVLTAKVVTNTINAESVTMQCRTTCEMVCALDMRRRLLALYLLSHIVRRLKGNVGVPAAMGTTTARRLHDTLVSATPPSETKRDSASTVKHVTTTTCVNGAVRMPCPDSATMAIAFVMHAFGVKIGANVLVALLTALFMFIIKRMGSIVSDRETITK